jgi:hypothetical protein
MIVRLFVVGRNVGCMRFSVNQNVCLIVFLYWLSSSAAAVMFAALVAAAEPPAAAAEPPVAVPRRKRGRSHGFRCTENTRMKMKISAARRRARNLSEKATKLHNALNPTTNEMAAERAFGLEERGRGATCNIVTVADGHGGSTRMYKRGDQLNRRLWKRGVVSQVRAVREHLPDFLSQASVVIVSAVMDDANIWVKRPPGAADAKTKKVKYWKVGVQKRPKFPRASSQRRAVGACEKKGWRLACLPSPCTLPGLAEGELGDDYAAMVSVECFLQFWSWSQTAES